MPSYAVVTFGCQMNVHDSARMGEVLRGAGYVEAERPESADVVLLNTCSVREKAELKLRSEVGRIARWKRARPSLVIGVTGCVAQQEGERLLSRVPAIDLVLGPDHLAELPALLADIEQGAPPRVRTQFDLDAPRFLPAQPGALADRRPDPCAFVTVMKGCDERCSFCIVPYTRGPERYRPASEIVGEVERLVAAGVREVTLLGQTVNSYRDPAGGGAGSASEGEGEFACLLRAIAAKVPALARLRYTSPHPRHLDAHLVRAHAELPVLARHVHLPVQSGSDRVLKRMIRRYDSAEYRQRVAALRAAVPGITLSTDVIVGFPGEAREDFEQTVALVREIGFTGVFGFKFSRRPGTPAARLAADVSEAEKGARLEELLAAGEEFRQAWLASRVGHEETILVEGPGLGGGFTGRTERNEIVHLGCRDDPTGELLRVRVLRAFRHSLEAEVVDPARRAEPPRPKDPRPGAAPRALPVLAG
ncbi:MAG: tRNA (N6-isopentenyl adenosine(37)-C2)-methylthiotransferase MiaB [Polyangiaceae bacterium]|nr:tRNA (N6-isopentenyl adenosine(37)-C2)-methylthiotransferase MiaB [Polyangiaceae bacterium]